MVTRHRLPVTRTSVTHEFTIHALAVDNSGESGDVNGSITVGLFANGMPGEIFIKLDTYGDSVKGFADQWAIVVSLALQFGVPLKAICEKGVHARFDPSGYTDTFVYDKKGNCVGKINATSVIDYICRWLQLRFLPGGEQTLQPCKAVKALADVPGEPDIHVESITSG